MSGCCAHCYSSSLGSEAASLCVECGSATIAGVMFSVPSLLVVAAVACGVAFMLPKLRSSAILCASGAMKLMRGRRDAATI